MVLCQYTSTKTSPAEIEFEATLQWIFNCSPEEIGKQCVKYKGKIVKKSLSPRERLNIFQLLVIFTTYLLPHCYHYLRRQGYHPKHPLLPQQPVLQLLQLQVQRRYFQPELTQHHPLHKAYHG